MEKNIFNVLFLCTANSARSVLAEAWLNHLGNHLFMGFSAGSQPKGSIHSEAIQVLENQAISTEGLRSKSWDEFAISTAPAMDVVVTVCDNAATEVCPVWPSHPVQVHWSINDPAAAEGSKEDLRKAFHNASVTIKECVSKMMGMMQCDSEPLQLRKRLNSLESGKNNTWDKSAGHLACMMRMESLWTPKFEYVL